jgi:hypothetical protein
LGVSNAGTHRPERASSNRKAQLTAGLSSEKTRGYLPYING